MVPRNQTERKGIYTAQKSRTYMVRANVPPVLITADTKDWRTFLCLARVLALKNILL